VPRPSAERPRILSRTDTRVQPRPARAAGRQRPDYICDSLARLSAPARPRPRTRRRPANRASREHAIPRPVRRPLLRRDRPGPRPGSPRLAREPDRRSRRPPRGRRHRLRDRALGRLDREARGARAARRRQAALLGQGSHEGRPERERGDRAARRGARRDAPGGGRPPSRREGRDGEQVAARRELDARRVPAASPSTATSAARARGRCPCP
jgi:hypothetical protein